MLGEWDGDALPKGSFQDMLRESCRSHAALLATMAPEGNLDARLPFCLVLTSHKGIHLRDNVEKHLQDEMPVEWGASSLAKYRGRVM